MPFTVGALVVLIVLLGLPAQALQSESARRETIPSNARRLKTDHLQVTTYVTAETVAPGAVFSLVFDVAPHQGLHVYAPGAKNYQIVNVMLEPSPLLIARPLQYPTPEIYYFAPLKERVPVFQKAFRLSQALAVTTAPEHQAVLARTRSVTIKGALNYQACDDRICYPPQSIPVSYTVRLR